MAAHSHLALGTDASSATFAIGFATRDRFVAVSREMRRAFDRLTHAAKSSAPVLVIGESGSGKEHVARAIHAAGHRSALPCVIVRCASLDDASLETELFGGEHGAFHRAAGGTVVLDEVGALSVNLQIKLVALLNRIALCDSANDTAPRVVATASKPAALSADRLLRPALRQTVGEIVIELPPLRQRREDIVPLAQLFFERASGGRPFRLSPDAMWVLETFEWSGNVRELEEVMGRAAVATVGAEITTEALSLETPRASAVDLASLSYRDMLSVTRDRCTREYLAALLASVDGNVGDAAAQAGIERPSFYRLLRRYGLEAQRFRRSSAPPPSSARPWRAIQDSSSSTARSE